MHPVLVELPGSELGFPLWPALVLLSAWGGSVAVMAFRRGARLVVLLGAALTVLAVVLAVTTRAERLRLGAFEVRSWGAAFALALVVGCLVVVRRAARLGLSRELAVRATLAACVGAVVGARVGWVALHPAATGSVEAAAAFYRGGLSVWGGLAGALAGAKLASRGTGTTLAELADLAAPSFGIGVALTRLGCYFEGCDFGVPLSTGASHVLVALGTFPKDSPAWAAHVLTRGLAPSADTSLAVHPVQLYEALGGTVLAAVAFLLGPKKMPNGLLFVTASSLYLGLRVSLDSLRDDASEVWVPRALLLCGALIGGGLWGIRFWRAKRPEVTPTDR
jgi:phosphatidylglycerol---prolipoprotein diacylglyceryl transferase